MVDVTFVYALFEVAVVLFAGDFLHCAKEPQHAKLDRVLEFDIGAVIGQHLIVTEL